MAVHLGIETYLQEARPFFHKLSMQLKRQSEKNDDHDDQDRELSYGPILASWQLLIGPRSFAAPKAAKKTMAETLADQDRIPEA